MKILIIEDDDTLRRGLSDHFQAEGCQVLFAEDGERGLQLAFEEKVDVILLDLMLPKVDGYEICTALRREKIETPILMLTAKGQVEDVVQGLTLGADDYLVKPFALRELDARVKVLVRRNDDGQSEYLFSQGYHFDHRARMLTRNDQVIDLTPKEYELLHVFLQKAGRALTREQLLSEVWGPGLLVTNRSVDRCVKTLREKLGESGATHLTSVRGVGYRWSAD